MALRLRRSLPIGAALALAAGGPGALGCTDDTAPAGPRASTWIVDAGTDAGPVDAGTDAGPPRPDEFSPVVTPYTTTTSPIESVLALTDGGALVLTDEALFELAADGTSTRRAAHAEVLEIRHAMRIPDGLLIGTQRGWLTIARGALEAPALESSLPAASVQALRATGVGRAWIAREGGVALWEDGVLRPFDLPVAIDAATLSVARTDGAVDLVWALAAGRPVRLSWDGTSASAVEGRETSLAALAVDTDGRAFAVRADGSVLTGDAPGALASLPYVEGVTAAYAAGAAVWLARADGNYVFAEGGAYFDGHGGPYEGTPIGLADGSLALVRADRIDRLTARWDARIEGVAAGDELLAPRTVRVVVAAGAPTPTTIDAHLAGVALPAGPEAGTFALDPASLVPGAQTLEVHLAWADGTLPVALRVPVTVPGAAPTWGGAIEAIYRTRCADCHGPGGTARVLDSIESWRSNATLILYDVQTSRMPKPPRAALPPLETARIEAWIEAGFPP